MSQKGTIPNLQNIDVEVQFLEPKTTILMSTACTMAASAALQAWGFAAGTCRWKETRRNMTDFAATKTMELSLFLQSLEPSFVFAKFFGRTTDFNTFFNRIVWQTKLDKLSHLTTV